MNTNWNGRLTLALWSIASLAQPTFGGPPDRPNIVFILADDLGYGDLGCYGQPRIETPHIDRLAAEGIRFTQHYAGSTVCAPSRCTLMTGRHTGHAQVRGNRRVPLGVETVTVAERLQRAGYQTALIGKWGLGEPDTTGVPTRQGFDQFFGYLNQRHAHNYYPDYLWRNETRVRLENVMPPYQGVGAGVAIRKVEYSHDLLIAEALKFIDSRDETPFFLYLALTIPHANNEAGKAGMEVPSDEPYTDRDWPQPQKNHAAMITRMDRDIGRLMRRLADRQFDANTVVLFTSDNGPHREGGADPEFFDSNGPLRGIKRDLYEGGIRVPLVARWPGKVPAGQTCNHPSAFWDFLPTACELARTDPPAEIDGISYLPALLGRAEQRKHETLYWEFYEQGGKQAVRWGDWKGIRLGVAQLRRQKEDASVGQNRASESGGPRDASGELQLFDLATDPGETNDIAPRHPDVVRRIERMMAEAHTPSPAWHFR
ncbi:MAG: arylsulfatase [Pirellulales bacterium]